MPALPLRETIYFGFTLISRGSQVFVTPTKLIIQKSTDLFAFKGLTELIYLDIFILVLL